MSIPKSVPGLFGEGMDYPFIYGPREEKSISSNASKSHPLLLELGLFLLLENYYFNLNSSSAL